MANKNGRGSVGSLADTIKGIANDGKGRKERAARARRNAETKAGLLMPWFLFAFANFALAFGEYRVYDYVSTLTGSALMGIGTLLATGIGFEFFFFGWKYSLATRFQQVISIIMMVVNFSMATYIGFGDYLLGANGMSLGATQQTVFLLLTLALALDVIAALAFFIADPQVKQQRIDTKTRQEVAQRKKMFEIAEQMLIDARDMLAAHQALVSEFGEEEVEAIMTMFNDGDGVDDEIANKFASRQQRPTQTPQKKLSEYMPPNPKPVEMIGGRGNGGGKSWTRPALDDSDLEDEHNIVLEPASPKAMG